ncbi:MAG TPA: L-seryl-tRNA(Sec) selenium transferase [Casimicrobiaceae bacterium]|nr:L-seryl-tRNA(Sec) selenium transferase [Casimicrobiaceae bacterium]
MSALPLESTVRGSKAPLSELPSVDRILRLPDVQALFAEHGRTFVTKAVRAQLAEWRKAARRAGASLVLDENAIVAALARRIGAAIAPALKPVFNLTGTVLHTNLGRALLPEEAVAAVATAMRSPTNLEFDLHDGGRGERDALVEGLLCELTGAQAATVVNNNAAAVLLTIAALAARREVVVSRGELVEIGGAFRMPDVMKCAGARLVEVGTTNRTHARDYLAAITPKTALIMKVHTSNFVVQGFTAAVGEEDLAAIAHRAQLPFAVDLGSGSLVDLAEHGLPREPLASDALARGADIVTFSGDKLLGGPQAGIIVGNAEWVAKIRRHPLKRALRVSKLTLAALEATLAVYRHPERLAERLPTLRLLTRRAEDIAAAAARIAPRITQALGPAFTVSHGPLQSQIGSGSLPVDRVPSAGLFVRCRKEGRGAAARLAALAAALRALPKPVIGRIADGALVLDLRTLEDEAAFTAQLTQLDPGRIAP